MASRYMLIRWNDVNDKVLNDTSKFVIINDNVINPSLIGLSPDLEYFAERIPFAYPKLDIRLAYPQETITMTEDVESSTLCRYYDKTWEVIERSLFEKHASIDNEKNNANFGVFPLEKQLEYLAMYAAIIRRELKNQNVTTEMAALANKVEAKVTKIWANHIEALDKKLAADNAQQINLDEGWENIDPETE